MKTSTLLLLLFTIFIWDFSTAGDVENRNALVTDVENVIKDKYGRITRGQQQHKDVIDALFQVTVTKYPNKEAHMGSKIIETRDTIVHAYVKTGFLGVQDVSKQIKDALAVIQESIIAETKPDLDIYFFFAGADKSLLVPCLKIFKWYSGSKETSCTSNVDKLETDLDDLKVLEGGPLDFEDNTILPSTLQNMGYRHLSVRVKYSAGPTTKAKKDRFLILLEIVNTDTTEGNKNAILELANVSKTNQSLEQALEKVVDLRKISRIGIVQGIHESPVYESQEYPDTAVVRLGRVGNKTPLNDIIRKFYPTTSGTAVNARKTRIIIDTPLDQCEYVMKWYSDDRISDAVDCKNTWRNEGIIETSHIPIQPFFMINKNPFEVKASYQVMGRGNNSFIYFIVDVTPGTATLEVILTNHAKKLYDSGANKPIDNGPLVTYLREKRFRFDDFETMASSMTYDIDSPKVGTLVKLHANTNDYITTLNNQVQTLLNWPLTASHAVLQHEKWFIIAADISTPDKQRNVCTALDSWYNQASRKVYDITKKTTEASKCANTLNDEVILPSVWPFSYNDSIKTTPFAVEVKAFAVEVKAYAANLQNTLFLVMQIKPLVDQNILYHYMFHMFYSETFMAHHVNNKNENDEKEISKKRYFEDKHKTSNTVIRVYRMSTELKQKDFSEQIGRVHKKIHCPQSSTCEPKKGKIQLRFLQGENLVSTYSLSAGGITGVADISKNVVEVEWSTDKEKFFHLPRTLNHHLYNPSLTIQ